MPDNQESKELEQGNIMTECNKCSCHNWDKITLWKCGNSECAELYPDTNGNEWENEVSAGLLKQLATTRRALDSAVGELAHNFTEKEIQQIETTVGAMRIQMERDGLWQNWWIKFVEYGLKVALASIKE